MRGQICLVTKLLTKRPYNREVFKATMKKIWRPAKPIRFHEMGSNMIMMVFDDKVDKARVIRDDPSNFD